MIELIAGLVVGVCLTKWVDLGELEYLRNALKMAHAQIAHAVLKEGATVPPVHEPTPPPEPLSKALQDAVGEWEGAEAQASTEAKIRQWLAEGYGEAAILKQLGGRSA